MTDTWIISLDAAIRLELSYETDTTWNPAIHLRC